MVASQPSANKEAAPIEERSPLEVRTMRRVKRRIIPVLALMLFLGMLDRTNISIAALTMREELGFSAALFGLGATVFTLSYCLLELPSNLILQKVGARVWFARIMVTWGLATMATAFVSTSTSFLLVRFLLGAAEAGLVPGVIYYISIWFPARYRAAAFGGAILAQPVASVVGNPIGGLILGHSSFGLSGWQHLFLIEGGLAVICAVVPWLFLANRPAQATWLPLDEREWLESELTRERQAHTSETLSTVGRIFLEPRMILMIIVSICVASGIHSVSYWLPTIVRDISAGSNLLVSVISAFPYLLACAAVLLFPRLTRFYSPAVILAAIILLAAAALVVLPFASGSWALVILAIAIAASIGSTPVYWTLATSLMKPSHAAAGIALINMIGNLGGGAGPFLIGMVRDATGSFALGYVTLGIILAVVASILFRASIRSLSVASLSPNAH